MILIKTPTMMLLSGYLNRGEARARTNRECEHVYGDRYSNHGPNPGSWYLGILRSFAVVVMPSTSTHYGAGPARRCSAS